MTGLPAVSLPLELAGVDRRHHGRHVGTTETARHVARSMTSLPGLGTLAGVDRQHHGRHVARSMTAAR